MKSRNLWIIPGVFFLIACAVNLYGCVINNLTVERYVKGALMPLLAVTGIAYLAQRPFNVRVAGTLLLAQMLGWTGDSLLMGSGFAWFVSGISCFLLGHICYISIFGRTLKGLRPVTWIITVIVVAAILVSLVLALSVQLHFGAPGHQMGAFGIIFAAFCTMLTIHTTSYLIGAKERKSRRPSPDST